MPPDTESAADAHGAIDSPDASDARAGRFLSRLLLVGLLLAVLLMVAGAVLAAAGVNGPMARASSLADLPHALASLQPWSLIILGLLVLLATPAARVVALLTLFAWRRSWRFCGLCLVVLAVLALSVFLGLRG
jgi:uncharacterized membrane protein